ncbi:MAG: TetR/AcrR family transcriptional regulator [Mycobacterium pseudokansasii]|uniref:HTH-type transcriptional regulator AcrR n=1 Tax=Mycobacterium pseudokansasii TaxID=2341080 RepID=A0A498QW43_9MYCO|nr:TetR/AcrR family transcriptional regulator [Mycobacterium pseudokansasii]MBY0388349.1 TetR/AcrR family transcriptional regulator [Mycobacterium pseudokansasii]VBA54165.1 HTH-type transcriptional regulator AcrR [Mycobacterium pseudokansasii]
MRSPQETAAAELPAGTREARRLDTRARLFDAALAEIARNGIAGADISSIAAAAGVVRGTFYFHFPTKEQVLVELERNEESRIVADLVDARAAAGELISVFTRLVHHVLDAERRLGTVVFRDMLGLHFSSTRPGDDELSRHPLAEFLIDVISRAQDAGQVTPTADARDLAVFFLTGLYALLATGAHHSATADALLSRYVTTIVKGMETR